MGEESAGVIQMIDKIFNDVEKENQVLELEEKDAQEDHEKFMEDAKAGRAEEIFDNFMCYCSNADEILGLQLRLLRTRFPSWSQQSKKIWL